MNDWATRVGIFRRKVLYSKRQAFDSELRPPVITEFGQRARVSYPDAFYQIQVDDVIRAMIAAECRRGDD